MVAGSPAPGRRGRPGVRRRSDVSAAAPRRLSTSTMLLSCLRPLADLRRARVAPPSGSRDARRVARRLREAVARATASGRLVRRSGLLLCDRVAAVQAELLEI